MHPACYRALEKVIFDNFKIIVHFELSQKSRLFEKSSKIFFLGRDDTPDAFQSIEAKPLVATKKDSIQSLCSARRKKFKKS